MHVISYAERLYHAEQPNGHYGTMVRMIEREALNVSMIKGKALTRKHDSVNRSPVNHSHSTVRKVV